MCMNAKCGNRETLQATKFLECKAPKQALRGSAKKFLLQTKLLLQNHNPSIEIFQVPLNSLKTAAALSAPTAHTTKAKKFFLAQNRKASMFGKFSSATEQGANCSSTQSPHCPYSKGQKNVWLKIEKFQKIRDSEQKLWGGFLFTLPPTHPAPSLPSQNSAYS